MCTLLFFAGCGGMGVIVPSSDSTPPTAELTAIVSSTTADETITLTSASEPVTRELLPDKPIKFLAIGRDEDGGVKNITIAGALTVFCKGEEIGLSIHYFANNPDEAMVGDRALTSRATALSIDPATLCAASSIQKVQGPFSAIAENFHDGTNTTAGFTLIIQP